MIVGGKYCRAVCMIDGSCWIIQAISGDMLGREKPRPSRDVIRGKFELDGSAG